MDEMKRLAEEKLALEAFGDHPDAGKWYVVHVLSGHEQKVRNTIWKTIVLEEDTHGIYEVLIAQEEVSEVKQGKKTTRSRKFFPGYILIRMDLRLEDGSLNAEGWHFINGVNGIIGFLGGDKAQPLTDREYEEIVQQMAGDDEATKPKIQYEIGEVVVITDGAFSNYEGVVDAIDYDRGKLTLMVDIFGRSTPAELEYWQVERQ